MRTLVWFCLAFDDFNVCVHDEIATLDLTDCNVEDGGAAALAHSHSLTHLNLSLNRLTEAGLVCFSENTHLLVLNVEDNKIGVSGVETLLARNKTIVKLNVEGNQFDEGSRKAHVLGVGGWEGGML